MVDVKICGVTDPAAIDAAIAAGARYLGFVFHPPSPRFLETPKAGALAAHAAGRAAIVAVTVDADDDALRAIAAAIRPAFIQCHGREPPDRVAAVKRFASEGVIKAIALADAADLAVVQAFAPACDRLLFDAKPPKGAVLPGGNGAAFDWRLLAGYRSPRPWFLSGGLDAGNVAHAIEASGAQAVDVSSGVEGRPGVKDAAKIHAFLRACGHPAAASLPEPT